MIGEANDDSNHSNGISPAWRRHSEFLVYVIPVGSIPQDVYTRYVDFLQKNEHSSLFINSLTKPGGYAPELSPFNTFSWSATTKISFKFMESGSISKSFTDCEEVHTCYRPIGVIGIVQSYNEMKVLDMYNQFVDKIKAFAKGFLFQKCFVFEHEFNSSTVEECKNLSDIVMFPTCKLPDNRAENETSPLSLHLQMVMETITVTVLLSIESLIRSAMHTSQSTIISPLLDTSVQPNVTGATTMSQKNNSSRHLARQKKLFGDFALLLTCYQDAIVFYEQAIESLREEEKRSSNSFTSFNGDGHNAAINAGDQLWLAATFESYACVTYLMHRSEANNSTAGNIPLDVVVYVSEALRLYRKINLFGLEIRLRQHICWWYVYIATSMKLKQDQCQWIKRLFNEVFEENFAVLSNLKIHQQIDYYIEASQMCNHLGFRRKMVHVLHEGASAILYTGKMTTKVIENAIMLEILAFESTSAAWTTLRFHILRQIIALSVQCKQYRVLATYSLYILQLLNTAIHQTSKTPEYHKNCDLPSMKILQSPLFLNSKLRSSNNEVKSPHQPWLHSSRTSVWCTPPTSVNLSSIQYINITHPQSLTSSASSILLSTPRHLSNALSLHSSRLHRGSFEPIALVANDTNSVDSETDCSFSSDGEFLLPSARSSMSGDVNGGLASLDFGLCSSVTTVVDHVTNENNNRISPEICNTMPKLTWCDALCSANLIIHLQNEVIDILSKLDDDEIIVPSFTPCPVTLTGMAVLPSRCPVLHLDNALSILKKYTPSDVDSVFFYSPFTHKNNQSKNSSNSSSTSISSFQYVAFDETVQLTVFLTNPFSVALEIQEIKLLLSSSDAALHSTSVVLEPYASKVPVALTCRPQREGFFSVIGCIVVLFQVKINYMLPDNDKVCFQVVQVAYGPILKLYTTEETYGKRMMEVKNTQTISLFSGEEKRMRMIFDGIDETKFHLRIQITLHQDNVHESKNAVLWSTLQSTETSMEPQVINLQSFQLSITQHQSHRHDLVVSHLQGKTKLALSKNVEITILWTLLALDTISPSFVREKIISAHIRLLPSLEVEKAWLIPAKPVSSPTCGARLNFNCDTLTDNLIVILCLQINNRSNHSLFQIYVKEKYREHRRLICEIGEKCERTVYVDIQRANIEDVLSLTLESKDKNSPLWDLLLEKLIEITWVEMEGKTTNYACSNRLSLLPLSNCIHPIHNTSGHQADTLSILIQSGLSMNINLSLLANSNSSISTPSLTSKIKCSAGVFNLISLHLIKSVKWWEWKSAQFLTHECTDYPVLHWEASITIKGKGDDPATHSIMPNHIFVSGTLSERIQWQASSDTEATLEYKTMPLQILFHTQGEYVISAACRVIGIWSNNKESTLLELAHYLPLEVRVSRNRC